MTIKEFVECSVLNIDENCFSLLKNSLFKYGLLKSEIINQESISPEILAEKICDYFETVEYTNFKKFYQLIDRYISDMDNLVEPKIEKERKTKENKIVFHIVPRARKYYKRAKGLTENHGKELIQVQFETLIDYSRIMLCLYSEIIRQGEKVISDFDISLDSIDIDSIIKAIIKTKKIRLDSFEKYKPAAYTTVIAVIMYYAIKNNEVKEE